MAKPGSPIRRQRNKKAAASIMVMARCGNRRIVFGEFFLMSGVSQNGRVADCIFCSRWVTVRRRGVEILWLSAFIILGMVEARAESCPTAGDEIATDRPDVTNSSLVVPTGSLQNENGVNFSMRDDGR